MHTVAIDTNRNLGVTLGKKLAVHTGLVLTQLVRAQGRVVLAHVSTIRVAMAAELRDLVALNLPAESRRFAHGVGICFRGITTMAIRASQSFLRMYVAGKLFCRDLQWRVQRTVTIETSILRLRADVSCEQERRQ